MSKLLEVGDVIRIQNSFNDYSIKVHRVTKTLAFGYHPNNKSYELKFKRAYYSPDSITNLPKERWSTTSYTLIKDIEKEDI